MKILLGVSVLLVSISFGASNIYAESTQNLKVKFSVEKMTCSTCPIAVRKAMERVDGVEEVKVDLDSKTAEVTYDASKATAQQIGAASTDVGFPAIVMNDDAK
jgi:mercuric transport protein